MMKCFSRIQTQLSRLLHDKDHSPEEESLDGLDGL